MNNHQVIWDIQDNESNIDYINRVVDYKRNKYTSKSWMAIAELINTNTGLTYDESTYRRWKIKDYSTADLIIYNGLDIEKNYIAQMINKNKKLTACLNILPRFRCFIPEPIK